MTAPDPTPPPICPRCGRRPHDMRDFVERGWWANGLMFVVTLCGVEALPPRFVRSVPRSWWRRLLNV